MNKSEKFKCIFLYNAYQSNQIQWIFLNTYLFFHPGDSDVQQIASEKMNLNKLILTETNEKLECSLHYQSPKTLYLSGLITGILQKKMSYGFLFESKNFLNIVYMLEYYGYTRCITILGDNDILDNDVLTKIKQHYHNNVILLKNKYGCDLISENELYNYLDKMVLHQLKLNDNFLSTRFEELFDLTDIFQMKDDLNLDKNWLPIANADMHYIPTHDLKPWKTQKQMSIKLADNREYTLKYIDYQSVEMPEKILVFLHGLSFGSMVFNPLFNEISDKPYRIIAPDLPPMGESGQFLNSNNERITTDTHIEMLNLFLEKLQLKKNDYILVGQSYGTHLSMLYVNNGKILPEKMIFLGSGGIFPPKYLADLNNLGINEEVLKKSISIRENWTIHAALEIGKIDTYREQEFLSYIRDLPLQENYQNTLNARASLRFSILKTPITVNIQEKIKNSCKTFLIIGNEDNFITTFAEESLYNFVQRNYVERMDTRVRIIEKCSHLVSYEYPNIVSEYIKEFIG